MDDWQQLEDWASSATIHDPQPTPGEICRRSQLFDYSRSEASAAIQQFRADLNRPQLTNEQWALIEADQEAEGFDKDRMNIGYNFPLRGPLALGAAESLPFSYIFKLGESFQDIRQIKEAVDISAQLFTGYGEYGPADVARVSGAGKRAIEKFLHSQASPFLWSTFIRLSLAPKDLSATSKYSTIGIDSSLPQRRARNPCENFARAQSEYPGWYFFHGTLTEPTNLQNQLHLDETPVLVPASIYGGRLRGWKHKYKGLVDASPTSQVKGWAFKVQSSEQEETLRIRETKAYKVVRCCIIFKDMAEILGLTFRFANPHMLDTD
ncbi:MAG: hypothetical protein Q9222_005693 [Ikaeria aurantiellina]